MPAPSGRYEPAARKGLRHQGQEAVGDWPAAAAHSARAGSRLAESLKAAPQRLRSAAAAPQAAIEVGFGGLGPVEDCQQGYDFTVWPSNRIGWGQGPAGQVVAEAARDTPRKLTAKRSLPGRCSKARAQHFEPPSPCKPGFAAAERSEGKGLETLSRPPVPGQVTGPAGGQRNSSAFQASPLGVGDSTSHCSITGAVWRGQGREPTGINRHRAPNPDCAGAKRGLFTKLAGPAAGRSDRPAGTDGQTRRLGPTFAARIPARPLRENSRDAGEMPAAIAGVAVTGQQPPRMLHAAERLQGLQQQAMGGSTIQLGQENQTR